MLIEAIRDAVSKRGWSDGEFTRKMGKAQSQWSRIKHGQREVTLAFLRAVARVLPELSWEITKYIFKED